MKYLLLLSLVLASTYPASASDSIGPLNEDVTRKINLEPSSVVEITTDIRFRPEKIGKQNFYYFVVPGYNADNLVSISATLTMVNSMELPLRQVESIPKGVLEESLNVTGELRVYEVSLGGDKEYFQDGIIGVSVKEVYKRRKLPFPSTIAIREEQMVRFDDSKYYVSVYPTKSQKTQVQYNTGNTM